MLKVIITDAVISKGYKDAPAFRFNDNKSAVNFKIGKRVYDKHAKDNHKYINLAVKAFNSMCERIEKMQLKEGSRINIIGKLDEEQWEENGQKFSRFVIISEEIEYASSDISKSNANGMNGAGVAPPPQNGNGTAPQNLQPASSAQQQNTQGNNTEEPSGFIGFENFDDKNVFYPEN